MASNQDFVQFVADQISVLGNVAYRKMFGEYMVYHLGRPVFLVCDNTVFVKQIPETQSVFTHHSIQPDTGVPYDGAKQHYILDVENTDLAVDMARALAAVLPLPKSRKTNKSK